MCQKLRFNFSFSVLENRYTYQKFRTPTNLHVAFNSTIQFSRIIRIMHPRLPAFHLTEFCLWISDTNPWTWDRPVASLLRTKDNKINTE